MGSRVSFTGVCSDSPGGALSKHGFWRPCSGDVGAAGVQGSGSDGGPQATTPAWQKAPLLCGALCAALGCALHGTVPSTVTGSCSGAVILPVSGRGNGDLEGWSGLPRSRDRCSHSWDSRTEDAILAPTSRPVTLRPHCWSAHRPSCPQVVLNGQWAMRPIQQLLVPGGQVALTDHWSDGQQPIRGLFLRI